MDICGDNRFEIIARAKKHLLDATNIDTSADEMEVLDDFLFRCWQMGWLDRYDTADTPQTEYPTEWCESCELWGEDNCRGVAQCKRNIEALKRIYGIAEDEPQTERSE